MSLETRLQQLRQSKPLIAPSLLKCDFSIFSQEVQQLESAGIKLLHFDVMDGHFVPNLTYGPLIIESLRSKTELLFDAHLMISEPAQYLDDFLAAGCDCITVHIEAVKDPRDLLCQIRDAGVIAGLALNPRTPVDLIAPYLDVCDQVLVMSVEPGFGGQKFIPETLPKLQQLKSLVNPETILSIDGGIGLETIANAVQAGADVLVVGSAIFKHDNYHKAIGSLSQLIESNQHQQSSLLEKS